MPTKFPLPIARSLVAAAMLGGLLACFQVSLAAHPAPRPVESLPPKEWDKQTTGVFPESPLSRLKGPRPALREATAPGGGGAAPESAAPSDGGRFAWSKIISPETVANEIKSQRPDIAEQIKNIGIFRGGGNRQIRRDFTIVAIMFGITADYDQPIRRKATAAAARDAFSRAAANAKAADENTFNEARLRSRDLDELVRGGTVDLPAPQELKWSQLIERRLLMARLDLAYEKRLRPATASAQQFNKSKESVLQEAEIIAALADIIAREGFESSDDAEYKKFAAALKSSALAAAAATKENNFSEVQRAAGDISKACSSCHGAFK